MARQWGRIPTSSSRLQGWDTLWQSRVMATRAHLFATLLCLAACQPPSTRARARAGSPPTDAPNPHAPASTAKDRSSAAPAEEAPTGTAEDAETPARSAVDSREGERMVVTLRLGRRVRISRSLTLVLTSFTHKRPFVGGPTKATATLEVTTRSPGTRAVVEYVELSEHGIEGKSREEDGLSLEERYDTVEWRGWTFRLTDFTYDDRIVVELRRPPEQPRRG